MVAIRKKTDASCLRYLDDIVRSAYRTSYVPLVELATVAQSSTEKKTRNNKQSTTIETNTTGKSRLPRPNQQHHRQAPYIVDSVNNTGERSFFATDCPYRDRQSMFRACGRTIIALLKLKVHFLLQVRSVKE